MNKCNHDVNSPSNTVSLFPRRTMVNPDTIYGYCLLCHKPLTFIKNQNNIFVLKEEKDEDI